MLLGFFWCSRINTVFFLQSNANYFPSESVVIEHTKNRMNKTSNVYQTKLIIYKYSTRKLTVVQIKNIFYIYGLGMMSVNSNVY